MKVDDELKEIKKILNNDGLKMNLYFSSKEKADYISKIAQIDSSNNGLNVKKKLIKIIISNINLLSSRQVVDYDPTLVIPDTCETSKMDILGTSFENLMKSFQDADNQGLENEVDSYNFYTIEVIGKDEKGDDQPLRIYRRVKKFKKLYSKGLLVAFHGNSINSMDEKVLGLDGAIDIIEFRKQLLIFSHISLERIFDIEETFSSKSEKALTDLKESKKISNFSEFMEDCLEDLRIQKTLTRMSGEDIDWEHSLDNFENVKNTIDTFDLGIEYQDSPEEKIVYDGEKSHLMDILRIVRDSYYQTMINKNYGQTDNPKQYK